MRGVRRKGRENTGGGGEGCTRGGGIWGGGVYGGGCEISRSGVENHSKGLHCGFSSVEQCLGDLGRLLGL